MNFKHRLYTFSWLENHQIKSFIFISIIIWKLCLTQLNVKICSIWINIFFNIYFFPPISIGCMWNLIKKKKRLSEWMKFQYGILTFLIFFFFFIWKINILELLINELYNICVYKVRKKHKKLQKSYKLGKKKFEFGNQNNSIDMGMSTLKRMNINFIFNTIIIRSTYRNH